MYARMYVVYLLILNYALESEINTMLKILNEVTTHVHMYITAWLLVISATHQ